nr:MAG TPA: hypothetical protein [Caudoviricetes sp.]
MNHSGGHSRKFSSTTASGSLCPLTHSPKRYRIREYVRSSYEMLHSRNNGEILKR